MNIPNYLPIGFFKGYSKENEEWVYGWHWTKTPHSPIVEKDSKVEHYIRVQHNHDWNLTSQEDYLVEPESVAQYIGKKDIDGTPLFLGDTVSFYFMKECHFGQIQFDTRILSYIVKSKQDPTAKTDTKAAICMEDIKPATEAIVFS